MAVIKVGKGGKTLGQAINYANKDKILSGKDCPNDPKQALEQMKATKDQWGKEDGRQYKHYIQSFKPGETTPDQANKIGHEWADKIFRGYEVVIGTHQDKKHIHNHIIVNSVNFENGKKLHLDKRDLERFKAVNDQLCRENELSVIDRTKDCGIGEVRVYSMGKYQAIAQGKSYIAQTAFAVDDCLYRSWSREEFIRNMKEKGYRVEWSDNRKNVTYTDQNGNKIRASNLEKTFSDLKYSKESMEHEFARLKEQSITRENLTTGGFSHSRNGIIEKQCSIKGVGQISARSLETSRNYSVDQSISNIQRKLQQIQARAGLGNQSTSGKNSTINRKQLKLREDDQERDW